MATKESLILARDMINDAYKKAKHAKYIGLLAFPDKTKFGRIVGKNGETVQKLQDETNTTIRVPKNTDKDHVIQITGSYWYLIITAEAHERYIALQAPHKILKSLKHELKIW